MRAWQTDASRGPMWGMRKAGPEFFCRFLGIHETGRDLIPAWDSAGREDAYTVHNTRLGPRLTSTLISSWPARAWSIRWSMFGISRDRQVIAGSAGNA